MARSMNALGEIGFSLKPPRWLRKMQPGKVLVKYGLPAAAVAATFFIPGVAPAAARIVAGGARLLTRSGGAVGRKVASLFKSHPGTPPITSPGPASPGPASPEQAAWQAYQSYSPGPASGGGGGAPSESPTEAGMAAPASGSPMPLILGGLALLALTGAAKRR
jgi:hypothetical protein